MIIVCEKCQSRFKLDEGRIKTDRFKARCSRCHHVFTATKPVPAQAIHHGGCSLPDQETTACQGDFDQQPERRRSQDHHLFESGDFPGTAGQTRSADRLRCPVEPHHFTGIPKQAIVLRYAQGRSSGAPGALPDRNRLRRTLPPAVQQEHGFTEQAVFREALITNISCGTDCAPS